MTAADKAFAAAERLIAGAKRTGATELSLDTKATHALTRLPDSIATLAELTSLNLRNTQVSDLTPLAGMVAMTMLYLSDTPVSDLTPLAGMVGMTWLSLGHTPVSDLRVVRAMPKLATGPEHAGLGFNGTKFTQDDAGAAKIAEIKDAGARAAALFEYLKDWVPPVPEDSDQVPGFVLPDDGPIRSVDAAPEGGDEDQLDLQVDLRRKVGLLIEAIGASNELAALKGSATHYRGQIDKPLAKIKLQLLYSAFNTLRVAYEAELAAQAAGRSTDYLPPLIAAPLKDVVETHGLFFMGFPNAAEIHRKALSGLTGGRNPAEVAGAEAIVLALEGKPQVLDPEDQAAMADDLAAAKGEGTSAEIGERRVVARVSNALSAFGRWAYRMGKGGAKFGAGVIASHDIIQWILGNQTIIAKFLKLTQGSASGWFDAALTIVRGLFGL